MQSEPITVLLADDDPHILFFLKRALQQAGANAEVLRFKNGEELITFLGQPETPGRNIDCILMDLNMPRKNGRETLAEIQSKGLAGNVPVLILSNSSYPKDIEEVMQLGAASFLKKPYGLEEYKLLAEKILSLKLPDRPAV